jgi:hypothetical protein
VLVIGTHGSDTIDLRGVGNADFRAVIGGAGDDLMYANANSTDLFVFKFLRSTRDVQIGTGDQLSNFSLTPPSTLADWKAWENYEARLQKFFTGSVTTEGSYLYLKSLGYTFAASVDNLFVRLGGVYTDGTKTPVSALPFANSWDSLSSEIKAVLGKQDIPKTINKNGKDTLKMHEWTDNELFNTSDLRYFKISIEGKAPDAEAVMGTVVSYTGADGLNDRIEHFDIGTDKLFLGNVEGKIEFKAAFTASKGSDPHSVVIVLNGTAGPQWQVTVDMNGLSGTLRGSEWSALVTEDQIEEFVWTHLVQQQLVPHLYSGWQAVINDYIM